MKFHLCAIVLAASVAGAASAPERPTAAFSLQPAQVSRAGVCRITSDSARSVVGEAWGGSTATSLHSFCRGFRLVDLRTGSSRQVVFLPQSDRAHNWAVDEPALAGDYLAYLQLVPLPFNDWKLMLLNLKTMRTRELDARHGGAAFDYGPLVDGSGSTITWVDSIPKRGGATGGGVLVYYIHTYDIQTGTDRIVAASSPNTRTTVDRFVDAQRWGGTIVSLRYSSRGSDVWLFDLQSGRQKPLTSSANAGQLGISGRWAAWIRVNRNAVGPVMVDDLRTGKIRQITQGTANDLSVGGGYLVWNAFPSQQYWMLDLKTNREWRVAPLDGIASTTAHLAGSALIVTADRGSGPQSTELRRILVYPDHTQTA